jgi:hypothetical protein
MSDEALLREARRIHERYQREIVEAFVFCPFAAKSRDDGVAAQVFRLNGPPSLDDALDDVRALGRDRGVEVAFLVYPRWRIDRPGLSRFVEVLRSAHQSDVGGLVMTMEGFHPDAAPDLTSPGSLVPFLRRTADPTIQLTRLSVLDAVRASTGGTKKYVDPTTIDVAALLAGPAPRSLHQRISEANHRTVTEHGVAAIARIYDDIRRDCEVSYARAERE